MTEQTLESLIGRYGPGQAENCPSLTAAGLRDAGLRGIRVLSPQLLELQLSLDRLPDATCLYDAEQEIARVVGAPQVRLALNWNQPVHPATTALGLMPWLMDEWRYDDGLGSIILSESTVDVQGDDLVMNVPGPFVQQVSSSYVNAIRHFFSVRAGLDISPRVTATAFDQKVAVGELEREQRSFVNDLAARTDFTPSPIGPDGFINAAPSSSNAGSSGGPSFADRPAPERPRYKKKEDVIYGKINKNLQAVPMSEITQDSGMIHFVGQVMNLETKAIKNGEKMLFKFDVFGMDGALACRIFVKPEEAEQLEATLKKKPWCGVDADVSYNQYDRDVTGMVRGLEAAPSPPARQDTATDKRVELHCHSRMSSQDAMPSAAAIVELAARFGHPAVAITDHGVVQAFPEACETAASLNKKGNPIKLILGMEGYLVDDGPCCVYSFEDAPSLGDSFVAIDLETTGFDPVTDRVIEIAAIRFRKDAEGFFRPCEDEVYRSFTDPGMTLPQKISDLTGITDFDLMGAPQCFDILPDLLAFIGDDPIVGHNVLFDLGFLRAEGFRVKQENDPRIHVNPVSIDTVPLARFALPNLESHRLNDVAAELGISLENHHRAMDDARCCGEIFARLYFKLESPDLVELDRQLGKMPLEEVTGKKTPVHHVILLVRSYVGLYYLYRLVSESHTKYFNRRPRIPRSLLAYARTGLLLGSACEAGEVFRTIKEIYRQSGSSYDEAVSRLDRERRKYRGLMRFYDYFEIQPLTNNRYLLGVPDNGINSEDDLIALNRLVIHFAKMARSKVVATCDSHFLEPDDAVYRSIMQTNMGFPDADRQPALYFRTTDEMLACFEGYLGPDKARELVIDNPAAIADMVEPGLRPFPDGSFPPIIDTAADDVTNLTWQTARELYEKDGELPEIVQKRVEKELKSIIDNGFAIMYYIAHKLVKKSNDDGYIVGSRGSVGSSLVATFCGITEVNPLAPHYRCTNCHYSEFIDTGEYGSGYDLPYKECPECGTPLHRDGQDIPFETFLGFNGDKQPDIDLNFSGVYQPTAHQYVVTMFGPSHTFRAGTIGSYAEKNAEGLVRGYLEKHSKEVNRARIRQLGKGLIGVKRTTGQHPGGIVVIPKEREIYDFTPIQYPANDLSAAMTTTHFDFNSMHDTILKLDILGHFDPTMLKKLGDLTGVEIKTIPIPDDKVMGLFRSTEPLGIKPGTTTTDSATLGLPELGTPMARGMIAETKPARFYNLVQLMGLSHGADVWKGNAQDLIRSGTATIDQVIGCRDDIMTSLIHWGLPSKASFDIMEKVRKGKGLTPEAEALMREKNVPDWYIESCKKISYMFPKAHAAAYSISSLRIAWFKVYRPEAFYCAYFTIRSAGQFDASLMCQDLETIRRSMTDLDRKIHGNDSTDKDKKALELLELVEEMLCRDIHFLPIDIMESEASDFKIEGKGQIRPALDAVPGISASIAEKIVEARKEGPFKSKDELQRRSGVGPSAVDALTQYGCLKDMPDSDQIDLFSLL